MKRPKVQWPIEDALHVKSAELWLEIGEPVQAMLELQKLPIRAREHPWAAQVFHSVTMAVRHQV